MSEQLDRATARRIAEALVDSGWIESPPNLTLRVAIVTLDDIADVIVEALAPAKPPGRTKRGKKGRGK